MDLREKKTRRSIQNAFLQLRRKKPLERITIKELAERAEISKATFYLHYKDIYDLSERLQEDVIQNILNNLAHPEHCLTDPAAFTKALFLAFYAEQNLIETLFSGVQNAVLPIRIEEELLAFAEKQNPNLDEHARMQITYTIHGGYQVYQRNYRTIPGEKLISFIGSASDAVQNLISTSEPAEPAPASSPQKEA